MGNLWEKVFMTTVFIVGNVIAYALAPQPLWMAFAFVTSLSLIKAFL